MNKQEFTNMLDSKPRNIHLLNGIIIGILNPDAEIEPNNGFFIAEHTDRTDEVYVVPYSAVAYMV